MYRHQELGLEHVNFEKPFTAQELEVLGNQLYG